jgi:hypothetical protein
MEGVSLCRMIMIYDIKMDRMLVEVKWIVLAQVVILFYGGCKSM